jgi:hypothetical protein
MGPLQSHKDLVNPRPANAEMIDHRPGTTKTDTDPTIIYYHFDITRKPVVRIAWQQQNPAELSESRAQC